MSLVSKVSDRVLAMSMGTELATGTPGRRCRATRA